MTPKATLIARGSLQDFWGYSKEEATSQALVFELHPAVKDLIEASGIPHTAIFGLTVNGSRQTLDYNVGENDVITIYPFEESDRSELDSIFSQPRSFVVDVHLGKLVKNMRLLGLDTVFNKDWTDDNLIRISNEQHRMLLTRDIQLLKNGNTQFGYWVRSQNPDEQIKELFRRFSLAGYLAPFSRCMKCNGLLNEVPLSRIEDQVPPKVKKWQSRFFRCRDCGQVYWKGSHFEKLREKVTELTQISDG